MPYLFVLTISKILSVLFATPTVCTRKAPSPTLFPSDNQPTNLLLYAILPAQVPESLSQLTNLLFLDLSRNSFDIAEIYWSDMSELRCLYMEEVRNDDGMLLDHSICHLHKLRELSCMSTRLHDLPDQIGNLVSLNFLQLTHCDLDELPESITRLTNLVELHAIGASFSSLPENFGNLRALEVIDFECNIDYIAIPPSFLHLTRLRKLTMPNTLIKPPGYDAFVTTLQTAGCNYVQNS